MLKSSLAISNDLLRSADRRCWAGLDGAIFNAAIRVVASRLSVRCSRSPDAIHFQKRDEKAEATNGLQISSPRRPQTPILRPFPKWNQNFS
jgi:hypothetical protein